jgi:hypothetical protein
MPGIISPYYLIDANLFVQAFRTYYSFEFAPQVWERMVNYASQGKIMSIDKVLGELNDGDDELKVWANSKFKNYFVSSQSELIGEAYSVLVNWVNKQPQYNQFAKDTFMDNKKADAWLIAYAKVNNCILVTQEKSNLSSQKRVMIPDVCNAFNIPFCDQFTMLKSLGFTL